MINSLLREIEIRSGSAKETDGNEIAILSSKNEIIETIYFGGGTPSLLSQRDIHDLLATIKKNYKVDDKAEITLEANPDDITIGKLNEWKNEGINRLSIGIQSFIERDLKWMNRAHNAKQAFDCIDLAREAGFNNFSIDLIFGTPNLSNEEWKENVQKVVNMNVPHLACYALTVEPKTALQKMIELKKKENVNSDMQAIQYSILMQMMHDAGYEHYEISNFAKPGFRSRHNSSYWQGKKYIGIGPSAHSYNGNIRMWNKANNTIYVDSIQKNTIPFEKEILTEAQRLNEYIMTSLRTIEGLDLNFIERKFSPNERKRIQRIILTDKGKLFADGIAVKLFL